MRALGLPAVEDAVVVAGDVEADPTWTKLRVTSVARRDTSREAALRTLPSPSNVTTVTKWVIMRGNALTTKAHKLALNSDA